MLSILCILFSSQVSVVKELSLCQCLKKKKKVSESCIHLTGDVQFWRCLRLLDHCHKVLKDLILRYNIAIKPFQYWNIQSLPEEE